MSNKMVVMIWMCLITLFVGWLNSVATAIENGDVVLGLVSIFLAPFASFYGVYLFF